MLYLPGNPFGKEGVEALADAIEKGALPSLKSLHVVPPHGRNPRLKAACEPRGVAYGSSQFGVDPINPRLARQMREYDEDNAADERIGWAVDEAAQREEGKYGPWRFPFEEAEQA